ADGNRAARVRQPDDRGCAAPVRGRRQTGPAPVHGAVRPAGAAGGRRRGDGAVRIIADTFAQLVTGQMRETKGVADAADPIAHYLKVVHEKTACLIGAAGRFGAMFSGADEDQIERLSRLGDLVGTAFQISDDIIDIDSDPDDSGKLPGTDLREGVHTLPVLYALHDTGPDADRLRELL